jgi:uncharacterized protein YbaR (Trm112 family)
MKPSCGASAGTIRDSTPKPREAIVSIPKDLLDLLACPLSLAPLVLDGEFLVSTDEKTRRRYRIDERGIPDMRIDKSEELDEETWKGIMERHPKSGKSS